MIEELCIKNWTKELYEDIKKDSDVLKTLVWESKMLDKILYRADKTRNRAGIIDQYVACSNGWV